MQEKIKRFIDCNVPTQVCNLKCPYCYVGQVNGFSGKIRTIGHSPEEVRAALSKKRMGGIILINFCGTGETLLGDEILPIVHEILVEGHFVQIVTNGTISKRFDEIACWDRELLDRLLIKFSYHYSEFLRLNLVNTFFDNVVKVRDAGCSFSVEITSGDDMIPYIEDMKAVCHERCGALPHVTVARDNADPGERLLTQKTVEDYANIWSSFGSQLFDVKMDLYGKKRNEFCYAGEWTFYLYLSNGDLKQCYKGAVIDNIFEDVNRPIRFKPVGHCCPEPYCFNGHAWMTLGSIPGMDLPTYADVRDRFAERGRNWLTKRTREFLYQKLEDNNTTYENTTSTKKIIFYGDSISKGYRELVWKKIFSKYDVYFPEGITTFSTHLLRYAKEYAENLRLGSNIDLVYFNAGLWDVLRIDGDEPLVSIKEYKQNLFRITKRFQTIFPNAIPVFALTTPVCEDKMEFAFRRLNADIDIYNEAAIEVMRNCNVPIHNLNIFAKENLQEEYVDFTHFSEKGYEQISDEIVDFINEKLKEDDKKGYNVDEKLGDKAISENINVLSERRIIIYGAGDYGERTITRLKKMHLKPAYFCDRNKEKQGRTLDGVPIISPEYYLRKVMDIQKDIVIVAISNPLGIKEAIGRFDGVHELNICSYRIFPEISC